jgi:hypothetical protein
MPVPLQSALEAAPGDDRTLALQICGGGLLKRRPIYYSAMVGLTVVVFAAAALVMVGNSSATLGVAAFIGVMFTQLAGSAMTSDTNRYLGLAGPTGYVG